MAIRLPWIHLILHLIGCKELNDERPVRLGLGQTMESFGPNIDKKPLISSWDALKAFCWKLWQCSILWYWNAYSNKTEQILNGMIKPYIYHEYTIWNWLIHQYTRVDEYVIEFSCTNYWAIKKKKQNFDYDSRSVFTLQEICKITI